MKTEQEIENMKLANSEDLKLKYSDHTAKVIFEYKPLFTIMFGCGEWYDAKSDITIHFNAVESPEWELIESHQVQGSTYFRIMKKIQRKVE